MRSPQVLLDRFTLYTESTTDSNELKEAGNGRHAPAHQKADGDGNHRLENIQFRMRQLGLLLNLSSVLIT